MEEGDYRASHTAPSHSTPSPLTLTHCTGTASTHMHSAHVSSPTSEVGGWEGKWVGREEEVSCPYLDLDLDLQVSPVDGEQCAVRAGGAQLPGAVGHVPVAVSQEDQRGEGGTWQEKVPSSAGEGRGGGLHFICTPTHTSLALSQWCELVFHSHCTSTPWTIGIPPHSTHPPSLPLIHPTPPHPC